MKPTNIDSIVFTYANLLSGFGDWYKQSEQIVKDLWNANICEIKELFEDNYEDFVVELYLEYITIDIKD